VSKDVFRFFAPCPRGLEQALAEELKAIGAQDLRIRASGVQFEGDRACGYAANLHCRIASRILRWLGEGRVRRDDDVYRIARRQDWTGLFSIDKRLRVDLSASRARARSLQYLTLRVKDGIVDDFRDQTSQRPSIDTQNPDVRVLAHLSEDSLEVYIDWSGESLFKRGWRGRDDKGEAPLKENLAAGLVLSTQWSRDQSLVDLFCGSGTILIEAAQMRFAIPAGALRRFGFECLKDFDEGLWRSIREEAARVTDRHASQALGLPPMLGVDIDPLQIERAKSNALAAGLPAQAIAWQCADGFLMDKHSAPEPMPETGFIVCNPPYGERIQAEGDFLQGRGFRDRWSGYSLCILSAHEDLPSLWRMKAKRKMPLMNGPIACRFFTFPLYDRKALASPKAGISASDQPPLAQNAR